MAGPTLGELRVVNFDPESAAFAEWLAALMKDGTVWSVVWALAPSQSPVCLQAVRDMMDRRPGSRQPHLVLVGASDHAFWSTKRFANLNRRRHLAHSFTPLCSWGAPYRRPTASQKSSPPPRRKWLGWAVNDVTMWSGACWGVWQPPPPPSESRSQRLSAAVTSALDGAKRAAPAASTSRRTTGISVRAGLTMGRSSAGAAADGGPPAKRATDKARDARAAKRQRRYGPALAAASDQWLLVCESLSISGPTRGAYQAAVTAFELWASKKRLTSQLSVVCSLDAALVKYFDYLFEYGHSAVHARNALNGLVFLRSLPREKATLPRARRALTGYLKAQPAGVRDPLPWEGALLIANLLLAPPRTEVKVLAGCAILLQFDMYMRPIEVPDIVPEAIVRPTGPCKHRGVIVAPHDAGTRKPAKNAAFDHTIFVGVPNAPRDVASIVLRRLVSLAPSPSQRLFHPLTLTTYSSAFRTASVAAGLQQLKATPHSVRHGGPSDDMYFQRTCLKEVARRGRWHCLQSFCRYEKRGRLQRQVQCIPGAQLRQAASLAVDRNKAIIAAVSDALLWLKLQPREFRRGPPTRRLRKTQ